MKVSWVIGVPPVLIHFSLGFSMKSTIQRAWVPHLMCDWCVIRHDSANAAALFLRVSLGCRGGAAREAEHHQPHLGETGCTQIAGSAGFHKWEYPQMDGKPDENGWFGGTPNLGNPHVDPAWSYTRYLGSHNRQLMCFVALCPSKFIFRSAVLKGNHPVPEAANGAGARHLQVGFGVDGKTMFCLQ